MLKLISSSLVGPVGVDEDDVLVGAVASPGPVEVLEGDDAFPVPEGRVAVDDAAPVEVVPDGENVVTLKLNYSCSCSLL